jgi:hypothetical protein
MINSKDTQVINDTIDGYTSNVDIEISRLNISGYSITCKYRDLSAMDKRRTDLNILVQLSKTNLIPTLTRKEIDAIAMLRFAKHSQQDKFSTNQDTKLIIG